MNVLHDLLAATERRGGRVAVEAGKLRQADVPRELLDIARLYREPLTDLLSSSSQDEAIEAWALANVMDAFKAGAAPRSVHVERLRTLRADLLAWGEVHNWPALRFSGKTIPPGKVNWAGRDVRGVRTPGVVEWLSPADLDAALAATSAATPHPPDEVPPVCSCGRASWWWWVERWWCGWCDPPATRAGRVTWWGEKPTRMRRRSEV